MFVFKMWGICLVVLYYVLFEVNSREVFIYIWPLNDGSDGFTLSVWRQIKKRTQHKTLYPKTHFFVLATRHYAIRSINKQK